MKYAINVPENNAAFSFKNGQPFVKVDLGGFTQEINTFLFRYGVKQFLSDAAASAKKLAEESGRDAETIRRELILEKLTMLLRGETKLEREAGRSTYLLEAIMELYGLSQDEAEIKLGEKSEKEVKALSASPKIAAKIAALKEAAAVAKRDRLDAAAEEAELPDLA